MLFCLLKKCVCAVQGLPLLVHRGARAQTPQAHRHAHPQAHAQQQAGFRLLHMAGGFAIVLLCLLGFWSLGFLIPFWGIAMQERTLTSNLASACYTWLVGLLLVVVLMLMTLCCCACVGFWSPVFHFLGKYLCLLFRPEFFAPFLHFFTFAAPHEAYLYESI